MVSVTRDRSGGSTQYQDFCAISYCYIPYVSNREPNIKISALRAGKLKASNTSESAYQLSGCESACRRQRQQRDTQQRHLISGFLSFFLSTSLLGCCTSARQVRQATSPPTPTPENRQTRDAARRRAAIVALLQVDWRTCISH